MAGSNSTTNHYNLGKYILSVRKRYLWALCVLAYPLLALGQVNKAGGDIGWTDGQNTGVFTESIPIEVPPFHGIEPHLSVNYNSDSSFGLMGVGWSLSGFSTIQRTGSGRGAPGYDGGVLQTADTFLLDGAEVIRCPTGSQSPSCTSGGNFTTLVEGYHKIVYTASNDTWAITNKEGIVYAYAPIWQEASNNVGNIGGQVTWRYGLQSVTDPMGNTVTYNWVTNLFAANWVGPLSVAYNGNTVTINYTPTPATAPIGYSDGLGMYHIHGVISSVTVRVGGNMARAYQFNYATSAQTGQDLLTSFQIFGKDAVMDAGNVASGTSLPPTTMSYSTTNTSFSSGPVSTLAAYNTNDQFLSMDVNGDGYEDLVTLIAPSSGTSWNRQIWFGSASGSFTAGPIDSGMDYNSNGTGHYLVMDVNGDGKADMIEMCGNSAHCGTTRFTRHLWLSNGSAFTSGASDTGVSYASTSQFLVEDVNGDGKQDMVELYPSAALIRHVWVSTGTAFTGGAQDNLTKYTTTPAYYLAEDVNGDGKGDMVEIHIDPDNAHWDLQLWLSNGGSFAAASLDKSMTYNVNSRFVPGDFNGDGQGDFVEMKPSGGNWIRTPHNSMGNSFGSTSGVDSTMWYSSTTNEQYFMADFNGDGHADFLELGNNTGTGNFIRHIWPYTPANQESFRSGALDTLSAYTSTSRFLPMDVNGDGLTDVVEFWPTAQTTWGMHIWLNTGPGIPDLLTGITNTTGGTTTIAYTPSSKWSNTNNPPLMETVTSVTESDGRGWSATTRFSYSGGLFDWSTGKFQGFARVTTTEPCLAGEASCPYTVENFDQPANCGSQSPMVNGTHYDGQGNTYSYSQVDMTYSCGSAPYTGLPTGHWTYTYDPNNINTYKRSYLNTSYDAYGNVTKTINYGDYDVSGDETTALITFNYNTSAFLVDHPASGSTYAGTTTGGTLLAQSLDYYDCDPVTLQNCNNSTAPTKGLVNRIDEYLNQQSYSNTTSSYLTTKSLFDSHGNVTDVYDFNNNHSSFAYDTTYSEYATKATNALGQSGTVAYDYTCGEVTSATDLNSLVSSTTLDALCRVTQATLPNGSYVKTQYFNLGSPTTQYVETDYPGPSGDIYSRQYFDGVGRHYKVISRGSSADTEVDTTYDARGNVSTSTTPYFVGGAGVVTTYSYDAMDRATKVTLPDNNTLQSFYGPNSNCNGCGVWSVTLLDPLGHKETDWHDAHGNQTRHDEYVGGAWSSATYSYDLLNHLATSTDPAGNVITYTTDSLGRIVGLNDPDKGPWTYTYDASGNVLTETDALVTQVVSYAYDALDRLTSKTTSGDGNTFTWAYDQAQTGYYNVGKLTAKSDPYGSETFSYDNVGKLVSTTRTTDGVSYPFTYSFDNAGRLLTESYPDGDSVGTLGYDAAGELTSVPNLVTSVTYDAMKRISSIVNANGTTQSFTYDPNRLWLTSVTTTNGSTNLQALTYGFDADGNRTSVTSNSSNATEESWTYAYDELHRVISATDTSNSAYSQSFTYDAMGNIVSNSRVGSYTYPTQGAGSVRPHAVTSAGGNSYGYDANGQMTSRAGVALTWNGDHKLSNDGSNAYYYGGDRDLLKLVNAGNTTRYVGDDFEVSPSGVQNKYILGLAVRVGTGGSASRWIHSDFNGTVQVQSDGTGTESMRKKYYATGDSLSTTGTDSQSKGFTGQRQESSGLTYLHERFYDPTLGRFISPDPITPGHHGNAGLNRYAYAMNDFVNKEDTSGFMFPSDGGAPVYLHPSGGSRVPAWTPICYYCYRPTPTGPVDLGGYHTVNANTLATLPHNTHYYRILDTYGFRGRLGRLGRKGRHVWTPICYYCHRGHTDLGGNHTVHWGGLRGPKGGCAGYGCHPRPPPPPLHCSYSARFGPSCSTGGGNHCGILGLSCVGHFVAHHWRGIAQVATIVAGAVAVAAVCSTGVGCALAGAIVGGTVQLVQDTTCGNCHYSSGQIVIDVGMAAGLSYLAPGVEKYFPDSWSYKTKLLVSLPIRAAITSAKWGVNKTGHMPGTSVGWGSVGWGSIGGAMSFIGK
jgi:RHS repeat-associated protein